MIYSGDLGTPPPQLLPDEQLNRLAIRVQPSENGQQLHPASRINFGNAYTVEHNIEVQDLGVVSPDHQPTLQAYFRESMMR